MTITAYDRTYWRSESNLRLIEEARHSGNELAIVLGERLQDCADLDDITALERENKEFERVLDDTRLTVADLRDDNAQLTREVETAEAILRRLCLLASVHGEHVGHIFGDVAHDANEWLEWLEQFEQGGRDDV
ncbi:MAG: hypothetical protein RLZZ387_2612 [Chloroflexota bacterium]|jgi:hypothetical protein